MKETDHLTVVTFNHTASCIINKLPMTASNKKEAQDTLKTLEAIGGTAMWDGLHCGLESIQDNEESIVIMFTDGDPSRSPPRGEENALREYYNNRCALKARLYTVALGKDISNANINRLQALAQIGGGIYLSVPDGRTLLTNISHIMANEALVIARDLEVIITMCAGETLALLSSYPFTRQGDTYTIDVKGTLRSGQPRNILAEVNTASDVNSIKVCYSPMGNGVKEPKMVSVLIEEGLFTTSLEEVDRCNVVKAITSALATNDLEDAKKYLSKSHFVAMNDQLPIFTDLLGEVMKGMEKISTWNYWGHKFLVALLDAHVAEQCTNFLNSSLKQFASSKTFEDKIAEINSIIDNFPSPTPSLGVGVEAPTTQQVRQSLNNPSGGCFGQGTLVLMESGNFMPIENIRKDMKVKVYGSGSGVVEYTVKFASVRTITIQQFGNLSITEKHPMLNSNEWVYPRSFIDEVNTVDNNWVYNLVLNTGHIITIMGPKGTDQCALACTLGHCFTGPVIEHSYLGTRNVVEDLAKFSKNADGHIEIFPDNVVRDPTNKWIVAYCPPV
jgi:hypothetical protein